MFSQQQLRRIVATALVAGCALVTPALTSAADLRSPDSQDNHRFAPAVVDHRTPDTIDLATRNLASRAPAVEVVHVGAGDGFDWGDAGIGAGGLAAVLLLAGGAAMMSGRVRRPTTG